MMNYIILPSLKHIDLVKIVATLWNQENIRALITKFNFLLDESKMREEWQKIEDKVIDKVPQLPCINNLKHLKEEILGFIKPIGIEILKWIIENDVYHPLISITLPENFCWTPEGTVDKRKTAAVLIKDQNLNVRDRFTLAYENRLEDDILELWNKIPDNCKPFYTKNVDTCKIKEDLLMMGHFFDREQQSASCSYKHAFKGSALSGNKAATVYFLQKLNAEDKQDALVLTAGEIAYDLYNSNHKLVPDEYCFEVLCYLLSQMDREQQREVFKSHSALVLLYLLDWPWQNFFVDTANCMQGFLSEENSYSLLFEIIKKVTNGYRDCNYQNIFEEFWNLSPDSHKRYVIDKCATGSLLFDLFQIEEKECALLILKHAMLVEKEKIIFSSVGKKICYNLIFDDKWDLLKLFIQECISCKDMMVKFKDKLPEYIKTYCCNEKLEKDMLDKFLQFFNDLIHKDNTNRSMEDGESSLPLKTLSTDF